MTTRRTAPPLRRLGSRVNRRGLLGAGVLAGVLAASGVPLQAGARGGTLRLALARLLPQGDWSAAAPVLAAGAAYDTLAEIGPAGELAPGLAVAWEARPGARVWHVALRRDARFHDGRPLTSADVAASLARHRAGPAAWALSRLRLAEPDGPHALRIAVAEGDPDLPLRLADPALVIGPEGRLDGTGTGPYRVVAASARLRLERVSDHWAAGREGWFDAIEAFHVPHPRARLDALLEGRADATDRLPPALVAEAGSAGLGVLAVPGNRQLHARLPFGADPSLAPLLPRALDRAALAREWGGTPAADHPLGPLHPAFAAPAPAAPDRDAAARLGGLAPRLSVWDGGVTEDAAFARALVGPWSALAGDPGLARLLLAARAAEGPDRLALYAKAQALCAARPSVAVAAHVPAVTVHAPALAHGAVSPHGPLDGGRLPRRWWFAT